MSSLVPWKGGKSRVAKRLVQLLPEHDCYVEPFAGAANLLFNKPKSKVEVINDINSDLINLFRIVRWHPREFISQLQFITQGRIIFSDYKQQPGLTDIQRAARTWFVLKTAFGGKGGDVSCAFGYGSAGSARLRRSAFAVVRKCHKRLDGVYIENLDFEQIIKRYDRLYTVFFCDPPYLGTTGFKARFTAEDHRRLAICLGNIKGKFLLTINDCRRVRRLYSGFNILRRSVRYTISRDKSPAATNRAELVIANYRLPKKW